MAGTTKKAERRDATLEVRRTFAAPRERVFRAWTQPEELDKWSSPGPLTPTSDVDLRVGGRYRIIMRGPDGTEHRVGGVYQVIEPPSKLVYTWKWEEKPDMRDSVVTVEFLDRGKSTEVVLRHDGLADAEDRARHEHGWNGCLEKLAALLQKS